MRVRNLYHLGKSSLRRYETTSRYIQLTVDRVMQCTPVDCGVPWMGGLRTSPEQYNIFLDGNSSCDGYDKKSNHQRTDSEGKCLAIDLVPYVTGVGFDYTAYGRFGLLGAQMLEAWEELQDEGLIPMGLYLHWGGFWSNKKAGSLGWDMAHYEMRNYPQEIKLAA